MVLSSESVQPQISTIRCDDHQASYAATSYLIGLGHERIGMLYGGARETPEQNGRLTGFHEAYRWAGPKSWTVSSRDSAQFKGTP